MRISRVLIPAAGLALGAALAAALANVFTAPTRHDYVRIATYNVSNLFDDKDDPYAADTDRYNDNELLVAPREQLEALGRVIRAVDADVIGLQEVENRGILDEFNRRYLAGLGYREVVLIEGNDTRGIDVALLSRLPVGRVASHQHLELSTGDGKRTRFSRDLLEVTVNPPGGRPFTVYVTHSKSQSGGKPADLQRLAEARMIRNIWNARLDHDPNELFVMTADLNDDGASTTLDVLQGDGETEVKAVEAKAPDGTHWTLDSRGFDPVRFDYVMASPAMMDRCRDSGVWRPRLGSQRADAGDASDHYPVWADFDL